jgi:hypothetical protein
VRVGEVVRVAVLLTGTVAGATGSLVGLEPGQHRANALGIARLHRLVRGLVSCVASQ